MRKLILALAFALSACSVAKDAQLAEEAVPKFHEQLDAGQFQDIYEQSGEDLKQAANRQEFIALLDAVHRKLGNTQSATKRGWAVNYVTSGTFVTLNYLTAYAEGEAHEQFVYRLDGQQALLVGYLVNSNTLILK
jgi:hypothetical protein